MVIGFVRKIGLVPQEKDMAAKKFATAVTRNLVLAMIDPNIAQIILINMGQNCASMNGSFLILEDMVARNLVVYVKMKYSV